MVKKELSKGIMQYVFEPALGKHFGNRVTVLINGKKVLLIDTGYEHQGKAVIEDLRANHLDVEKAIISHFHDDHMGGLKAMQGVMVYGSSACKHTLDMWTAEEEHKYFTPSVLVERPLEIEFGSHRIEMIPFPGHSICTMLVKINDEYIHIADELMFSNSGEPLLPSVIRKDIGQHYDSVNRLRKYSHYIFIPGHGDCIMEKNKRENAIENVSTYLGAILNNDRITYEEATKGCSCTFLHKEWHENIYK